MQFVAAALTGYAIEASDGRIGSVSDLLFDDRTWKLRWLVVDTGDWMPGRKVLLHPSVIGTPDHDNGALPVALTMARIKASPDISRDQPVSRQVEANLYGYYGWDPMWGGGALYNDGLLSPLGMPLGYGGGAVMHAERGPPPNEGDPHLRSMAAIRSYHLQASDGGIGHVENLVVDDADWTIRYLIVDTKNWLPGRHVLISPHAVTEIDWSASQIHLAVTRRQVETSPQWDVQRMMDQAYAAGLHRHYGWPGGGW